MSALLSPRDIQRIQQLRKAVIYATLGSLFLSREQRHQLQEEWLRAGVADDPVLEAQLDRMLGDTAVQLR